MADERRNDILLNAIDRKVDDLSVDVAVIKEKTFQIESHLDRLNTRTAVLETQMTRIKTIGAVIAGVFATGISILQLLK